MTLCTPEAEPDEAYTEERDKALIPETEDDNGNSKSNAAAIIGGLLDAMQN